MTVTYVMKIIRDMSYFNRKISIYQNVTDNKGAKATLRTFLLSDKYKSQIEELRTVEDKNERNRLKKLLPCITVSGIFEPIRATENLIEHSGLICIDIDGQDNRHIQNFTNLKEQIARLDEVLYCGLSASGNGYFVIIPIQNPKQHREHFKAIQEDFNKWGIIIDSNCKDVTRLRGYSYDPEPYINENAKVYSRVVLPTVKHTIRSGFDASDNISKIVDITVRNGINMCECYSDWFAVGCAIASELGELGREYFHALSRQSSKYKQVECDRKYNDCLKTNRISIATLFQIAKDYGIMFKG